MQPELYAIMCDMKIFLLLYDELLEFNYLDTCQILSVL